MLKEQDHFFEFSAVIFVSIDRCFIMIVRYAFILPGYHTSSETLSLKVDFSFPYLTSNYLFFLLFKMHSYSSCVLLITLQRQTCINVVSLQNALAELGEKPKTKGSVFVQVQK